MADFYIDSPLGAGANDGSTPGDACRGTSAIKNGLLLAINPGDMAWFSRRSEYDEGVVGLDIDLMTSAVGDQDNPVTFAAWPRAAIPDTTLTEATWTNGDPLVEDVVGLSLTKEEHVGRHCVAPDGEDYFIIAINSATSFTLDRSYVGADAAGVAGKFEIVEDELYSVRPAAGIAAGWDAHADTLPLIDFNSEAYSLIIFSKNNTVLSGFNIIDSSAGGIGVVNSSFASLKNIICQDLILSTALHVFAKDIIIDGGIGLYTANATARIENIAVDGSSGNGLEMETSDIYMQNASFGTTTSNTAEDLSLTDFSRLRGLDIYCEGISGISDVSVHSLIEIENYQKLTVFQYKHNSDSGVFSSVPISLTSANKKLSDFVFYIEPNVDSDVGGKEGLSECIASFKFFLTAGAHNIKFWIYNDLGATLNDIFATENIFLEADYISAFDAINYSYVLKKAYSTEINIAQAADADDWDFLSVDVSPVIDSVVNIRLFLSVYSAANTIVIDPRPVLS